MEIIYSERMGGKTHRLVMEASTHDGIILVANQAEAGFIRDKIVHELMGNGYTQPEAKTKSIEMVRTSSELPSLRGTTKKLYIDNIENYLFAITVGRPIEMCTTSSSVQTPQGKSLTERQPNPHLVHGRGAM